jgi:hypothetical protein
MFLVALGSILYAAMLPMAARSGRMVGNFQQANSLVQHKIDQLRAVGYGRLTYTELRSAGIIDASPTTSPYAFTGVDGLTSIYPSAVGTITVTDFSTSIRQVQVDLTWTGSPVRQGNGTLTAVALVARP